MKNVPTSIKEKIIPRAEAPCNPFTKRRIKVQVGRSLSKSMQGRKGDMKNLEVLNMFRLRGLQGVYNGGLQPETLANGS
eukprot:687951-Pelagomonas_calceolata.AAC.2